jgi:hypothetical protein
LIELCKTVMTVSDDGVARSRAPLTSVASAKPIRTFLQ